MPSPESEQMHTPDTLERAMPTRLLEAIAYGHMSAPPKRRRVAIAELKERGEYMDLGVRAALKLAKGE